MDRDTILELVTELAPPDLAASVVGVSPSLMESVGREVAVVLPGAYRGFLEVMGEDTRGFAAVAPTHSTRMSELLPLIPGPAERTRRYWRISIERNLMQQMPVDYYLDLSTSDGRDAEVVAFDYAPERDTDVGALLGLRFFELLRCRLFDQYVVVRPSTAVSLHVSRRSLGVRAQLRDIAVDVLAAEGLQAVARHAGRVDFFRRADDSVLVRQFERTDGLAVFLEMGDRERCVLLLEKLRDRFPADAVVRWPKR